MAIFYIREEPASRGPSKPHLNQYQHQYGYTLFELMLTCILSISILAIATPSLASMINNSRVNATSIQLYHSLSLARSTAISHSKTVLVCQISEPKGSSCVKSHKRNSDWRHGWLVYIDENRNNNYDSSDQLLQKFESPGQTAVVFNQNGRLRFLSDGSSRSSGFYVCTAKSNQAKHIKLLYSGRARIVKNTSPKTLNICKRSLI